MYENNVSIVPCNNGYLVTVPFNYSASKLAMREQADIMVEAVKKMQQDLPGEEWKQDAQDVGMKPEELLGNLPVIVKRTSVMYVFKEWKEVIEFLATIKTED